MIYIYIYITVSLERAHRQCIKHMQAFSQCTRSGIAPSYIGIHPIKYIIGRRKLLVFGQLCVLDTTKRIIIIFNQRLVTYMSVPHKVTGIPDIYRMLRKYALTHV